MFTDGMGANLLLTVPYRIKYDTTIYNVSLENVRDFDFSFYPNAHLDITHLKFKIFAPHGEVNNLFWINFSENEQLEIVFHQTLFQGRLLSFRYVREPSDLIYSDWTVLLHRRTTLSPAEEIIYLSNCADGRTIRNEATYYPPNCVCEPVNWKADGF